MVHHISCPVRDEPGKLATGNSGTFWTRSAPCNVCIQEARVCSTLRLRKCSVGKVATRTACCSLLGQLETDVTKVVFAGVLSDKALKGDEESDGRECLYIPYADLKVLETGFVNRFDEAMEVGCLKGYSAASANVAPILLFH